MSKDRGHGGALPCTASGRGGREASRIVDDVPDEGAGMANMEERQASYMSGWIALPIWLAAAGWAGWTIAISVVQARASVPLTAIIAIPVLFFLAKGFVILEPNLAAVLTFFGRYAGTIREDGFFWYNPFCKQQRVSLRANNLNTPTLKVNDRAGNPVEVAAVIVWRVSDTARASFDVADYVAYVTMQSESAVRHVVSTRWYDGDEHGRNSLRGDLDAVAELLNGTIQEHVGLAGLEILEARISHLAYAAEIAGAMLRRQQAEAVVAARAHIVEGAVSMVKLGLERLHADGIVQLSDADRVKLATNLMTVLVSDTETHPVLSVGKD
jgi:regulator of protease activity HflC (stomatin/prohibitin superfamily)